MISSRKSKSEIMNQEQGRGKVKLKWRKTKVKNLATSVDLVKCSLDFIFLLRTTLEYLLIGIFEFFIVFLARILAI